MTTSMYSSALRRGPLRKHQRLMLAISLPVLHGTILIPMEWLVAANCDVHIAVEQAKWLLPLSHQMLNTVPWGTERAWHSRKYLRCAKYSATRGLPVILWEFFTPTLSNIATLLILQMKKINTQRGYLINKSSKEKVEWKKPRYRGCPQENKFLYVFFKTCQTIIHIA